MKRASVLLFAIVICLSCAVALANDQPQRYYYKGNARKMHVAPRGKKAPFKTGTGKAAMVVTPAVGAAAQSGISGASAKGRRYFGRRGVVGRPSTRTIPVKGGGTTFGGQIGLPTQTFSVGPGTVMVPYSPRGMVRTTPRRKHLRPYYSVDNWAPPY